jgi:PBSX family phage terminase large subunit
VDDYFDIHVPGPEHYFAEGILHHNTGKSIAALMKLYLCAWKYPGMRALIVRKTRESLTEAALVTWEEKVVPEGHPMLVGPQRRLRQVYRYGNGSEIVVGGLDKASKVMSTEYDLIFVQEAIELTEVDWASLLTRLRNGKMPYQQLLADTNPAHPTHWLKKRCDAGVTRMIIGRHDDNPTLVNPRTGAYTNVGKTYMAKLESLPDMMRKRLRYGLWVQAEGAVYEEWNPDVHVVDSFAIPPEWTRYMGVDFGFVNPLAVGFWAADPDGRLYLYREIYKTRTLVEDIAKEIKQVWADELSQMQDFVLARGERDKLSSDEIRVALEALPAQLRPAAILCDHDAEDRKTLEKHLGNVVTRAANKAVSAGIQALAERLKVQKDGKPRLMVFRDALAHPPDGDLRQKGKPTNFASEIEGYVWDDAKVKEQPLKENDHSVDQGRYIAMHLSGRKPAFAFLA